MGAGEMGLGGLGITSIRNKYSMSLLFKLNDIMFVS